MICALCSGTFPGECPTCKPGDPKTRKGRNDQARERAAKADADAAARKAAHIKARDTARKGK